MATAVAETCEIDVTNTGAACMVLNVFISVCVFWWDSQLCPAVL